MRQPDFNGFILVPPAAFRSELTQARTDKPVDICPKIAEENEHEEEHKKKNFIQLTSKRSALS